MGRQHRNRWIGAGAGLITLIVAVVLSLYWFAPGYTYRFARWVERYRAGLEVKRVDVDGFEVPYLIGGEGPPLVLLHGFGGDRAHWVRVAPHLRSHFRIVAPDLPGFGDSTRNPNAEYTYPAQIRRLETFLDRLQLESVHLGGNSMGGELAGRFAVRHEDRVRSLWLVAPGGVESARPSELDRLRDRGENPLLVETRADFDRLWDFVFVDPPYVPGPIRDHLVSRARRDRSLHRTISKQLDEDTRPLEKDLRGVSLPTLILWGNRDRLLHVSGARRLGSAMPGANVVVLEETGHLPMMERPVESAAALLAFHGIEEAID